MFRAVRTSIAIAALTLSLLVATAGRFVSRADDNQLKQIRQRLANARKSRTQAQEAIKAAQSVRDEQGEYVAQRQLDHAQVDIETAERLESILLSQIGGVGGYSESFVNDPDTVHLLERLATTGQPAARVELGSFMSVDQMVEMINTGDWGVPKLASSGGVVPDSTVGRRGPYSELGLIPQPRRLLRLLDLIPASPAVGNTVPYIIESGSFDTALETAENALKATGDIGLTDGENPIRTIAHYLKAPRQLLSDIAGFENAVRLRLIYGVMRRLENQLLAGDGVGQNLLGLLTTSGVGNIAFASATALADLSLEGLVAVLNSEGEPDAAVMNPTTLASLLTPKASGSGEYMNIDSPFGTGPTNLNLWGIPVVTSTVMPANQILFGNFGQGCRVWIREAANVILGLDSDDLTRNRITLLGEGRFGFTVNVPSYFAVVNLAA